MSVPEYGVNPKDYEGLTGTIDYGTPLVPYDEKHPLHVKIQGLWWSADWNTVAGLIGSEFLSVTMNKKQDGEEE